MLKNVFKVFLSNAVLAAVGVVNSLIFPMLLTIGDYAFYQKYLLYISYVNICHLGIASGMFLNYAGHAYAETDRPQYKSEIYLIFGVLAVFTAAGLAAAGISRNLLVFYVALTIFPQCVMASFQALYQAWNRFTGYAVINALPKVLLTAAVIAVYFASGSVTGNFAVLVYLLTHWILCAYFVAEFAGFTKGAKSNKLFTLQNKSTVVSGFLITLGNYINLLFHAIDKQFVSILYSTESFAYYSFAMTTQTVMTLFITALANPFYPRLARNDLSRTDFKEIKELLLVFGAYSGCAYFAVSFVVRHWIVKYVPSLEVVSMFFAVFPAMAVINVLYINLYRIRRQLKKYVLTLTGMVCVAALANTVAVLLHGDYIGISLATMICYYIWLFWSQRDFEEVTIGKRDIAYLAGFMAIYYAVQNISNDVAGFFIYGAVISLWNVFMYRSAVKALAARIFHKRVQRKKEE